MKGRRLTLDICTVFLHMLPTIWHNVDGRNTTAILSDIMTGYDKRLRPNDSGPPVMVKMGIYVETMEGLRESTMDFSLTVYLQMDWNDPRLAFTGDHSITFKSGDMYDLWIPDVNFLYEKQAKIHAVTQVNSLLVVRQDGNVTYSTRISATLACKMELQRFPMDSQRCTVVMCSYAYNTDDVVLYLEDDSIEIEPGITISKFTLTGFEIENDQFLYSLGNYSTPKCHFFFKRQMESYFLTVYIPTVLLVSIAWLSFWIDARAAPARVSLGITTVLTVTTMTSGMQETLPAVTYAKALDVWLAACLVFVFFSLLEYGVANYLLVLQFPTEAKERDLATHSASRERPWTAHRLDCLARFVFPLAFIAFNLFYWVTYLVF